MNGSIAMPRDLRQRRLLLRATGTLGGIGIAGAMLPFVQSMAPSNAARSSGAPVDVRLDTVKPGNVVTVAWRGKPVWILHRTEAMLAGLRKHDDLLADPQSRQSQQPSYAANEARSIRPNFFVAIGICTHLGCVPIFRPEVAAADLGDRWPGGFFCPCHGSKFDLAGRVFKSVPAPLNLEIPPHEYLGDTRLVVGRDRFGAE
ncbi:ubiquinol-cytochrome c reductase iron-sulfur subunit (plasmid) [Cupriavidus basilensis]|uniref:ubiquinol-cytochrome c reductase iron-sulfur subunit n=1 Tax=unclassified Cupriavidus TaxID=2640874 RepID=UPI0010F8066D|nr:MULTISPECIES: ubiquinol-cytochrome c reductase iron-sulfur subunit [unclassified Cupriavidus]MWL92194.1 ubiquinol-cytochrome c reductase iron-sulfur subunit [Cupriavidus sp. SW-Y-13]